MNPHSDPSFGWTVVVSVVLVISDTTLTDFRHFDLSYMHLNKQLLVHTAQSVNIKQSTLSCRNIQ